MVEFAKFAKNYTSPKDVDAALFRYQLYKALGSSGIVCKTGDVFARVKPDGKVYSIYIMSWLYRPSERKGVNGKYFPTAYNMKTYYVRTPQKTATPYEKMVHDWTIQMFEQALRYVPGDTAEWKDPLYQVVGNNPDGEPILAEYPIIPAWFKE